MLLMITYNLVSSEKDYRGLYKEIKKAKFWWHHLKSTWIIRTEEPPEVWFKRLSPKLHKSDKMLVIELKYNFFGCFPPGEIDWLGKNFKKDLMEF